MTLYSYYIGLNEKNNNVGLVEAVVTFGQTFSATPSHSLHTQKTRTVWRQVETGIFLVITVNIPWVKKQTKEGDVHEYRPDEVSDKAWLQLHEFLILEFSWVILNTEQ